MSYYIRRDRPTIDLFSPARPLLAPLHKRPCSGATIRTPQCTIYSKGIRQNLQFTIFTHSAPLAGNNRLSHCKWKSNSRSVHVVTDFSSTAMPTETVISTQYHGVGPDNFSFDCSITNRSRDKSDLLPRGEAPVSSSFRVAPTGISISGHLESSGNYIQEVHVRRIPPEPTATQASIGEGYAHTLYDGETLFKKLLPLGADVCPSSYC